eukprot:160298-Chlamydomonas_euryale.AAC.1
MAAGRRSRDHFSTHPGYGRSLTRDGLPHAPHMRAQAAGGSVETVLIPTVRAPGQRSRITICVSSQVWTAAPAQQGLGPASYAQEGTQLIRCIMNCLLCFTSRPQVHTRRPAPLLPHTRDRSAAP